MQHNAPVVLKQVRDLGEIITDTFRFLKENWRPLFRAIGTLCLPVALLSGFIMGKSLGDLQLMLQNFSEGNTDMAVFETMVGRFLPMVLGYGLFILAYLVLIGIVHEYMRAYQLGEHHGITPGELWSRAWPQLGSYFGATFLSGLLILLGFVLCILPGLYPLTVLALVQVCHAMERTGGGGALSRSNTLVMHQFWPTLGLVLVVYILQAVLNGLLNLPFSVVSGVLELNKMGVPIGGGDEQLPFWYATFTALSTAFQLMTTMLVYPIVATALCLKYFTLIVEHEGAGLAEKIQGFEQA